MHLGRDKARDPNTFVWIPRGRVTFLFRITLKKPLGIAWERLKISAQWQPVILKNWIPVGYLGFPFQTFLPAAVTLEGTFWIVGMGWKTGVCVLNVPRRICCNLSSDFWHRCPRLQRPTTPCHHCLCMTSLPPVPIPAQIKEDPSFSPDLRQRTVRNLQMFWVKASFRSLSERGAKKKKKSIFATEIWQYWGASV